MFDVQMARAYRLVKGREDKYRISDVDPRVIVAADGRIISMKGRKPRLLKQSVRSNGALAVQIGQPRLVHMLVANAFLENYGDYIYVRHKDGNKKNNHVSNLEWCSFEDLLVIFKES